MTQITSEDRDRFYIENLIISGRKAERYASECTPANSDSDEVRCLAVAQLLSIVAHASQKVTAKSQRAFGEHEWKEMSLRLSSATEVYITIDNAALYEVAINYLPSRLRYIENIFKIQST